jgi:hypothetical protein
VFYEGAISAINGQKISGKLAGDRECSLVPVALRRFSLVKCSQLRVEPGSQMYGFQQHRLQMPVPLLERVQIAHGFFRTMPALVLKYREMDSVIREMIAKKGLHSRAGLGVRCRAERTPV